MRDRERACSTFELFNAKHKQVKFNFKLGGCRMNGSHCGVLSLRCWLIEMTNSHTHTLVFSSVPMHTDIANRITHTLPLFA